MTSTRSRLLLIALLALAIGLTVLKIPLASSQGVTIAAAKVDGALPVDDVQAALWQEATAVSVPLSAQVVARPMFPQANVKAVAARALYNDEQIAFLVEWDDETMDDSTVRVQDFSDAVAIQFPLVEGQPFFCMGQQDGNVNIWHWKADWQAAMVARQDVDTVYPHMYVDGYPFADEEAGASAPVSSYEDISYLPAMDAGNLFASASYASPVEDLIAGSFGSLTSQPLEMQNVQGHGEYADGRWRVIFVRDRQSPDAEDAQFETGQIYSLAFAAWDGANEERNGQKSTSQWVSLQLGAADSTATGDDAAPDTLAGDGQLAAPADPDAGSRPSTTESMEGLAYIFGPMLLVLGLALLLGLGVWQLSRLPGKK
ncbi:MAG TPA: ethylbenzene dehydrogenase-related protein [Candidatus Sulfomarinibacteraceae bacterium]|nr:ethylbenzene dehydrogenase-related protein [Candidatus Sulfomarinibacteraceae bacterium]